MDADKVKYKRKNISANLRKSAASCETLRMKTVLLHICCGVCSSSVVERLRQEGFKVTGFFYNPNIHPEEEYKRRLEATRQVSQILDFPLIEGAYDKENWFEATKGLKDEPEGGKRCEICFKMRLEQTYKKSCQIDADCFTTTLSVSPHKNVLMINKIGKELDKKRFLDYDFKKRDGFKLAAKFSKKHNLYRQDYCGCVYSMKRMESKEISIKDADLIKNLQNLI